MKTILIRSGGSLRQWSMVTRSSRIVFAKFDLESVRTMLGKLTRIIQDEWYNSNDYKFNCWFYRVPEREWNLLVLAHPEILKFFQVVDDENN